MGGVFGTPPSATSGLQANDVGFTFRLLDLQISFAGYAGPPGGAVHHPPSLLLGYLLNHELAIAIAKASCDSTCCAYARYAQRLLRDVSDENWLRVEVRDPGGDHGLTR